MWKKSDPITGVSGKGILDLKAVIFEGEEEIREKAFDDGKSTGGALRIKGRLLPSKQSKPVPSNRGVSLRSERDEHELESERHQRSRALSQKVRDYEALQGKILAPELEERYLVDFERKEIEDFKNHRREEDSDSEDYAPHSRTREKTVHLPEDIYDSMTQPRYMSSADLDRERQRREWEEQQLEDEEREEERKRARINLTKTVQLDTLQSRKNLAELKRKKAEALAKRKEHLKRKQQSARTKSS